MAANEIRTGRRRVPRRSFDAAVGILLHGKYCIGRTYQVGEGGMMISGIEALEEGTQIVVSFFINSSFMVIVRGAVRSVVPPKDGYPLRHGLEFQNLGFQYKREIRNFVSQARHLESA